MSDPTPATITTITVLDSVQNTNLKVNDNKILVSQDSGSTFKTFNFPTISTSSDTLLAQSNLTTITNDLTTTNNGLSTLQSKFNLLVYYLEHKFNCGTNLNLNDLENWLENGVIPDPEVQSQNGE